MLGRAKTSVYDVLQCAGGIAPAKRHRSSRVLSLAEREEVSRGIAAGYTIRAIARTLNRAASTVSQEVSRHGGRELYRAAEADLVAWESARRPKFCLLAKNRDLQRIVAVKLKQDWAPQQIAGWLKDEYPKNPEFRAQRQSLRDATSLKCLRFAGPRGASNLGVRALLHRPPCWHTARVHVAVDQTRIKIEPRAVDNFDVHFIALRSQARVREPYARTC